MEPDDSDHKNLDKNFKYKIVKKFIEIVTAEDLGGALAKNCIVQKKYAKNISLILNSGKGGTEPVSMFLPFGILDKRRHRNHPY